MRNALYLPYCRNRKVTIWARLQLACGEKFPFPVPLVMLFWAAHAAAFAKYAPAGTSLKLEPLTVGDPAARYRKVTVCPRVTVASGEKVSAPVPLVMPRSTAHKTAL